MISYYKITDEPVPKHIMTIEDSDTNTLNTMLQGQKESLEKGCYTWIVYRNINAADNGSPSSKGLA